MMKIKIPATGPIILVLSGGGSKGAWICGVLQYLHEVLGCLDRVVVVVGTSTGALIAALLTYSVNTGDWSHFREMLNIYRTVEDGNILDPRDKIAKNLGGVEGLLVSSILQGRDSLYSTSPLLELIDAYMEDGWGSLSGQCEAGFCTTNMQSGMTEMWYAGENTAWNSRLALLASASQPLLMTPVVINGVQHCDGGLIDAVPTVYAWDWHHAYRGATVLAISPTKAKPLAQKNEYTAVPEQLQRTLEIMVDAVPRHNHDTMRAKQAAKPYGGGTHWIEPTKTLKGDGLSFVPKQMGKWMNQGFADAARKIELEAAP